MLRAPQPSLQARFEWHWFTVPLALYIVLFSMDTELLDQRVGSWFFDPAAHRFVLSSTSLLADVTHYWADSAVILLGCTALAGALLSCFVRGLLPWRTTLLFVPLALTAAACTASLYGELAASPCPLQWEEFGGYLTASPGTTVSRKACLPGAHTGAAFGLIALYFAGRLRGNSRLARIGLYTSAVSTSLIAWAALAQGSERPSQLLWCALLTWLVILALYLLLQRPAGR